jgi:GH43 family beta-xylosidase
VIILNNGPSDAGADPMVPSNWWRLDDRPVFWSSDVAFGPGHASFPFDRAGVPWVVYHATDSEPQDTCLPIECDTNETTAAVDGGWEGRTVRIEQFGWNPDSSPAFPTPKDTGIDIQPGPA